MMKKMGNLMFIIDPSFYDPINKYWSQFFDYEGLIRDKKIYLIESPLKCVKKQRQVISIFNKYKIHHSMRNSPLSSASLYETGDIKIGEDDNFYIVSHSKWIKYNKFIIEHKEYDVFMFIKNGKSVDISKIKNIHNYKKKAKPKYYSLIKHKLGYVTQSFIIKSIHFDKNLAIVDFIQFEY